LTHPPSILFCLFHRRGGSEKAYPSFKLPTPTLTLPTALTCVLSFLVFSLQPKEGEDEESDEDDDDSGSEDDEIEVTSSLKRNLQLLILCVYAVG